MYGKLKALNINSVQSVAEALMAKNGATTTLEVKNQLRKEGFFALQAEVSAAMDFLAWENDWTFSSNGQYRTYHFGDDTNLAFYCHLEKAGQYWEIAVKENFQIIRISNQKGKGIFTHRYDSNRQAIAEAGRLLRHREHEGYVQVPLPGTVVKNVLEHFEYLNKTLLQCTVFFHSVTKIEEHPALFTVNGSQQLGLVQTIKKAGYEFTFDMAKENNGKLLKQLLQVPEWDAGKIYGVGSALLGEKIMSTSAMLLNGTPATDFPILEKQDKAKVSTLEVGNKNLYRIDFQFRDSSQLILRKDQFESVQTLLALAIKLLSPE